MRVSTYLEEEHESVNGNVEGGHVGDLVHSLHLLMHHLAVDNGKWKCTVNSSQKGRHLQKMIVIVKNAAKIKQQMLRRILCFTV